MIFEEARFLSSSTFGMLYAVMLVVVSVVAIAWIAAIIGTVRYGRAFAAAQVSQGLTWILLIFAPLVGAIFFFAMRPRLKRAQAEELASAWAAEHILNSA